MRAARLLTTALLLNVVAWSPAAADVITDPASLGSDGSPLFDGSGIPFLWTTAPTYFQLPGNGNANDGDGNGNGNGNGNGPDDAAGPFFNPVFFSFLSGPFGSGDGDLGDLNDGADTEENTEGDVVSTLSFSADTPSDDPPSGDSPTGEPGGIDVLSVTVPTVPEPAAMLLLGAGFAAFLRRRSRASTTV